MDGVAAAGELQKAQHLALFVDKRAMDGILGHGDVEHVIAIFLHEGLCILDSCLDGLQRVLAHGVGEQPCRRACRRHRRGHLGSRCLSCHLEAAHVVHVVDTQDALHIHLLTVGIDDNGSSGTQERRQVAEGLALVANKHTMAAGEQRAVGTEGGQGENRFGCLLHRSRLGIQGMNHSELPHEERELEGDEYDDSFHE